MLNGKISVFPRLPNVLHSTLWSHLSQRARLLSFSAFGQHHARCGYDSKEWEHQLRKVLSKGSRFTSKEEAHLELTEPDFGVTCLMSSQLQLTFLKPCKPEQSWYSQRPSKAYPWCSDLGHAQRQTCTSNVVLLEKAQLFYLMVFILPIKSLESFAGHTGHPTGAEGSFARV